MSEPFVPLQMRVSRRTRGKLKATAAILEIRDMGVVGQALLDYGIALLEQKPPPQELLAVIERAKKEREKG